MKIIDMSKCDEDVINYINKLVNNYFGLEKLYNEKDKEIERLNNIIDEALKKSRSLQYRFGYVLDDLIYLLMQGSDKE